MAPGLGSAGQYHPRGCLLWATWAGLGAGGKWSPPWGPAAGRALSAQHSCTWLCPSSALVPSTPWPRAPTAQWGTAGHIPDSPAAAQALTSWRCSLRAACSKAGWGKERAWQGSPPAGSEEGAGLHRSTPTSRAQPWGQIQLLGWCLLWCGSPQPPSPGRTPPLPPQRRGSRPRPGSFCVGASRLLPSPTGVRARWGQHQHEQWIHCCCILAVCHETEPWHGGSCCQGKLSPCAGPAAAGGSLAHLSHEGRQRQAGRQETFWAGTNATAPLCAIPPAQPPPDAHAPSLRLR